MLIFIYYGFVAPQVVLKDYALDIYTGGMIVSVSEIVAPIVGLFLPREMEKKTLILGTSVLAGILSCVLYFCASCDRDEECSNTTKVMQAIGVCVFRFFGCLNRTVFIVYMTEIFPSQARAIGMQAVTILGAVAFVLIPPIQTLL